MTTVFTPFGSDDPNVRRDDGSRYTDGALGVPLDSYPTDREFLDRFHREHPELKAYSGSYEADPGVRGDAGARLPLGTGSGYNLRGYPTAPSKNEPHEFGHARHDVAFRPDGRTRDEHREFRDAWQASERGRNQQWVDDFRRQHSM